MIFPSRILSLDFPNAFIRTVLEQHVKRGMRRRREWNHWSATARGTLREKMGILYRDPKEGLNYFAGLSPAFLALRFCSRSSSGNSPP